MSNPLGVTYKLNPDDIQAAQWHCLSNSPSMRRNYRITSAVVLLLTLLIPTLPALFGLLNWTFAGALVLVVVAVWVFEFPRSYRKGLERNTQKLLREGRNAFLHCTYRLEIDEGALSVKSELGESRLGWGAVERVTETDAHIFIHLSSLTGYAVPKWAFETDGRAREFFEAANEFQRRAEFS